jgi:hypothetical protein
LHTRNLQRLPVVRHRGRLPPAATLGVCPTPAWFPAS